MEVTMVQFGSDTLVLRAPFIEVIMKKFKKFLVMQGYERTPFFKPARYEEEEVDDEED